MKIAEAIKFYEQDKKKYIISKNRKLLNWLKCKIKNGYHSFISAPELQELVDSIANWYEIKYPERELQQKEGITDMNFANTSSLAGAMNMEQLLYRLPSKYLSLIKCNYRARCGGIRNIYDNNGQIVDSKEIIMLTIKKPNDLLLTSGDAGVIWIYADAENGNVDENINLRNYQNEEIKTIPELLSTLQKQSSEEFDLTELEECLFDHDCDIELRRQILQLVALKLLYSKKTVPERGYERAKSFINEFVQHFNINLSSDEIDELMNDILIVDDNKSPDNRSRRRTKEE